MYAEYEFQKHIFLKHIKLFSLLVIFLALAVTLAISYLRMDPTMAAYVVIGVLTSLMASLIFVYPESRDHYLRGQYKLLAIAESAAVASRDLSRLVGHDVLINPRPNDEELKRVYSDDPGMGAKVRAFLPRFQELLEVLVLSSPELEVEIWEALYHAKRDMDVQSVLPPGANDLVFMAKALRMMEEIGETSIFLKGHLLRPRRRKRYN